MLRSFDIVRCIRLLPSLSLGRIRLRKWALCSISPSSFRSLFLREISIQLLVTLSLQKPRGTTFWSLPKRSRRGGSPSSAIAIAHQPSTMFLLDWCEATRADANENDARHERMAWIARGEGRSRGRGLTPRNDRTAKVLRRAQRTWTVEQEREDPVLGAWETDATTCT